MNTKYGEMVQMALILYWQNLELMHGIFHIHVGVHIHVIS